MKRWDDSLLSLNIYKHRKKKDENWTNKVKEAQCQDVFMDLSKGWNVVTSLQGSNHSPWIVSSRLVLKTLRLYNLYIKISRSYFNGSDINKNEHNQIQFLGNRFNVVIINRIWQSSALLGSLQVKMTEFEIFLWELGDFCQE